MFELNGTTSAAQIGSPQASQIWRNLGSASLANTSEQNPNYKSGNIEMKNQKL